MSASEHRGPRQKSKKKRARPTGYDKYIDYRYFSVAAGIFLVLMILPAPASMVDVGVEYALGTPRVLDLYARQAFGKPYAEVEQWQAATCRALERVMRQGVSRRDSLLARDRAQLAKLGVSIAPEHFARHRAFVQSLSQERFAALMAAGRTLRHDTLTYAGLSAGDRAAADRATWLIRVSIATMAFVVVCFLTECIPLPGVAFCIGLIFVFCGVVSREDVASLFWSDACWFIMGSLMFAAAFVKTGVDKRICLLLFRALARPSVPLITGILIVVIAPAASFISDHALAAMFLPIALILYNNSLSAETPSDPELAKMLMVCIAMACNIGGFGSPSGGARNVIIITYLEDMFGITVGYGEWIIYAMPFVLCMIPLLWLTLNWRFKPKVRDLRPALATLRADIGRRGPWSRQQVVAVLIFVVMLLGWITEKNLLRSLIGVRLGIGVIAVAGAVAYLLAGVVNWRDYQEKVDWGVVWLYAGAIIFGRTLDQTGAAYWLARSVVGALASVGLESGLALLGVGAAVTASLTNLMADGPAAAAVGPVTLNMAAVSNPGTTLIPFMGLATAAASSFAYLLVIGTPPNAIVYASGILEPKDLLRVGVICFVAAFALLLLLSLVYWPMLGFQGLRPL